MKGRWPQFLDLMEQKLKEVTDAITADGFAVQPANLNCPGQIVISGTKAGVEKACDPIERSGREKSDSA